MSFPMPYVGVSGFMSGDEVKAVLTDEVRDELHRTHRKLAIGVLASHKTLLGERPAGKWRWRYPKLEDIASIFQNDRQVLNLVHFNTKESDLFRQLTSVTDAAGPWFDGFQLNIVWPDPIDVDLWVKRNKKRGDRVILQLNQKSLDACTTDEDVLRHIDAYAGWGLTDILFDLSGGDGEQIIFGGYETFLTSLRDRYFHRNVSTGVAGGLGPDSLETLEDLYARMGNLYSCDAESRLRTVVDVATGEDRLDVEKARRYVLGALRLIK